MYLHNQLIANFLQITTPATTSHPFLTLNPFHDNLANLNYLHIHSAVN